MARGRMINSRICRDKRVDDLSDDTCRLAFTWLISFADVQGRVDGDPALLASTLFPRRRDVTPETMTAYIQEWHDAGLVVWYQADGDRWIWFPSFDKNQRGLDRRKEPVSEIPVPPGHVPGLAEPDISTAPSTYQVRTESVPSTCQVPHKRTEQKLNRREGEEKLNRMGADAPAESRSNSNGNVTALMSLLDHSGVVVSGAMQSEQWVGILETTDNMVLIGQAFEASAKAGKRPTPGYITAILDRCLRENCAPDEWPQRSRASPGSLGVVAQADADVVAAYEKRKRDGTETT